MNEEKNCPCCPNHCSVDSLSCGRGKSYFSGENKGEHGHKKHHEKKDESLMTLEEKTLYKMRRCGHALHHSHEDMNLDFLTDEEKQALVKILSKCIDNWN